METSKGTNGAEVDSISKSYSSSLHSFIAKYSSQVIFSPEQSVTLSPNNSSFPPFAKREIELMRKLNRIRFVIFFMDVYFFKIG